ncbi:BRCT domain-containing protein, partial [Hysterangium stoloniferum]
MPLFDEVRYYISESLCEDTRTQLSVILNHNGAREVSIDGATHILSNTIEIEGASGVQDCAVYVTPYWVERSMELGALQDPKFYSADRDMFFSGVVATSADLPIGDKEMIAGGLVERGGAWRQGLTRDVTHLFVTNTNSDKYKAAYRFQEKTRVKIVLPHWFDQCFSMQMLLPTDIFEFPEPLYMQKDYDPAAALEEHIKRTGGILLKLTVDKHEAEVVEMADVLITRYREGPAYNKAMIKGITIGTLAWFFYVVKTGIISRPRDQLLHYPVRSKPIPEFAGHVITVTNYQGEERDYLKKLIEVMGATFTPSMSGQNTVVVAAYKKGHKTTKAEEWSLPVVNHKWLEDCFIEWRNLTPAQKKYLDYSANMDYGTIVGERGVGHVGLD